ncbi:hypothetical protein BV898_08735 [Hypsibius exemplaris]|uniref:Uncharacterized protein n=1 Tax=Hypsibius exemplaris TaxID=2072580 RepID=A0A1W0WPM5_HYPEX|nr:hypothetical protein BV898_08735 [Hypsibius exemplaris]
MGKFRSCFSKRNNAATNSSNRTFGVLLLGCKRLSEPTINKRTDRLQLRPTVYDSDCPSTIQTDRLQFGLTVSDSDRPSPIRTVRLRFGPSVYDSDRPSTIWADRLRFGPTVSDLG